MLREHGCFPEIYFNQKIEVSSSKVLNLHFLSAGHDWLTASPQESNIIHQTPGQDHHFNLDNNSDNIMKTFLAFLILFPLFVKSEETGRDLVDDLEDDEDLEHLDEDLDYFYDYEAITLMKEIEEKANGSTDLAKMFFEAFSSAVDYYEDDYDYTEDEEDVFFEEPLIILDFEESSGDDTDDDVLDFLKIGDTDNLSVLRSNISENKINWALVISVIIIFVVGLIIFILTVLIILKSSRQNVQTEESEDDTNNDVVKQEEV